MKVYADFGFEQVSLKIALRPEKRLGTDETWDRAEEALYAQRCAPAASTGRNCRVRAPSTVPKIEYHLKDSIGRPWQLGTMQVDFMMPERLGAEYVGEDNSRRHPVMLHRAIVGSMERFIGILLENCAGALPAWLSPQQAVVLSITDSQADYAQAVAQTLKKQGFRIRRGFAERQDRL